MYQMHPVTEPRRKVYLIHVSGEVYVYDSYRQFLSIMRGDILHGMGKSFREVHCYYETKWRYDYLLGETVRYEERIRVYIDWVAHWDHRSGSVIDPEQLKKDWKEYENALYQKRRFNNWWYVRNHMPYEYRCDPVPCVHHRSYHKGSYYRRIRTTQERRWSLAVKDDGIRWRSRRNFHNLPNAWDDVFKCTLKSWKKYRKHQWKD